MLPIQYFMTRQVRAVQYRSNVMKRQNVEKYQLQRFSEYSTINPLPLTLISRAGFLRCFRDPFRVLKIENRVLRIREKFFSGTRFGSPELKFMRFLHVHTRYLTFSLKKL